MRNIIIASTILFGISGVVVAETSVPTVKLLDTSTYECANTDKITASFYGLEDGSLNFVKFDLGGKSYTLPQIVSASGARYTDELEVELWADGEEISLSRDLSKKDAPPEICKQRK